MQVLTSWFPLWLHCLEEKKMAQPRKDNFKKGGICSPTLPQIQGLVRILN